MQIVRILILVEAQNFRKANAVRHNQMKKAVYISLALVLFVFASAENAFACGCAASLEPLEKQIQAAFTNSVAIFSGTVVEVRESRADESKFIVKLKVAQSWKGAAKGEIFITTAKESSMCGYFFQIGEKYLVYANGLKNDPFVESCSRTAVFSDKNDAKYLSKIKRRKKSI
jgi:hypothetical protein